MKTTIPVENGDLLAALQGFLRKLLESEAVELLQAPMHTPYGTVAPALISNPELIAHVDPLAPVMPVNSATLAGRISSKKPRPKAAVLLRSCEARALVELTKMQQASLDDLVLVTIDCAGTYSVPNFGRKTADGDGLWKELFKDAVERPAEPVADLRQACKMCEQPAYTPRPDKDIALQLFGYDLEREFGVTLPDALVEKLGLVEVASQDNREAVLAKLVDARIAQRDAEFALIRQRLEGPENITGVMAACIRCHNCMTVCPICYCKTCVFKSALFDHEPAQFANWTTQKGALRLPTDTSLFHLTRLNHMGLSCVGCGMCTEACPAELPVGLVFRAVNDRLDATFDYHPGRSLDEPLPLVTFKADEWTNVGE